MDAKRLAVDTHLASGNCDVHGWEARTLVDDRIAGRVHQLLLDERGSVRWLELELESGRRVLLPAGQARASREDRCVWLPGLAADQLALLPDHDAVAGLPDAAREETLLAAYGAALLRERLTPRPAPEASQGAGVRARAHIPGADGAPGDDPRLNAAMLFGGETP